MFLLSWPPLNLLSVPVSGARSMLVHTLHAASGASYFSLLSFFLCLHLPCPPRLFPLHLSVSLPFTTLLFTLYFFMHVHKRNRDKDSAALARRQRGDHRSVDRCSSDCRNHPLNGEVRRDREGSALDTFRDVRAKSAANRCKQRGKMVGVW